MMEDHELWSGWITTLKNRGLNDLVSFLINACKPLAIILSQLATMAMPLVATGETDNQLQAFIDLLENREELAAFSKALHTEAENR